MRFYNNSLPKENEERTITFFAWTPVRVRNEIRWLEKVTVVQFYKFGEWTNIKFINQ
jgi:hypothetical protein